MTYDPTKQAYRSRYSAYGIDGDKCAVGWFIPVAGALYADADTISLPTKTYELDDNASVTPGNVAIVFTGAETAAQMKDLFLAAMQANETSTVVWWDAEAGKIRFRNKAPGVDNAINISPGWPAESEVSGIVGGQRGTGQPARFGPVRAFVPNDAGGRGGPIVG